ncbi:MAG: lipid-binding SYLF domain-containing protein [Acidisphaera sp.]|nr:lipid-binding SYLF domain-containing protein [Acidisphaera sp.]
MSRPLRLATLVFGALLFTAPAYAQVSDAQEVVRDAAATIHTMRTWPGFAKAGLLRRAKAVLVFPNVVKAGFVVGAEGGQGVLLAHRGGGWSDPAFYVMGSLTLGPQVGGQIGPVVLIIMSQRAYDALLGSNTFSLKATADLAVVDFARISEAPLTPPDIVVWTHAAGLFAGLTVGGTDIKQRTEYDEAYYGRPVTAAQIVTGARAPGARALRGSL